MAIVVKHYLLIFENGLRLTLSALFIHPNPIHPAHAHYGLKWRYDQLNILYSNAMVIDIGFALIKKNIINLVFIVLLKRA